MAAGRTAKDHSCTLDQAIALGSIWAIAIAIVLPHVASNHPQGGNRSGSSSSADLEGEQRCFNPEPGWNLV